MEKIIFTCKTVTPLVMNGAYGDFPELRPPGIKASLRFWWRALHGHLQLEDRKDQNGKVIEKGLRTIEGEIFGSTKGRSKVLIRVEEPIEERINNKTLLLPHKNSEREKSPVSAFISNLTFKVRIDCESNQVTMIKNLFVVACTLGGWGKRSRRGFGAVTVTEINNTAYSSPLDLKGILACIDHIIPSKHKISGLQIESTHVSKDSIDNYPKLWKIEIGTEQKSIKDISGYTHDVKFNSQSNYDYSQSIGDGKPRFASPIYVSILSDGRPIISTLKKEKKVNFDLQNELKSKILNP